MGKNKEGGGTASNKHLPEQGHRRCLSLSTERLCAIGNGTATGSEARSMMGISTRHTELRSLAMFQGVEIQVSSASGEPRLQTLQKAR